MSLTAVAAVCLAVSSRFVTVPVRDKEPETEVVDAGVPETDRGPSTPFGYRVNHPDGAFKLDGDLYEISGLSPASEPGSLWAINDEQGTLFRISMTDGAVLERIPFGKGGDYESVEQIGDKVYIGRSDGVLFVVDPKGAQPTTELKFQLQLGLTCDLEGLGYQPSEKRLLMSCKSATGTHKSKTQAFSIFAMDDKEKVNPIPVLSISRKQIDDYIAAHPEQPELHGSSGKSFAPSSIAVHPKSGEIYVLSSAGRMLVVLNPQGEVVTIQELTRLVHPQPEGLAFDSDGTMFISSEARGSPAGLLNRFAPIDAP